MVGNGDEVPPTGNVRHLKPSLCHRDCKARNATKPIQTLDEARDSVASLFLSQEEIITAYKDSLPLSRLDAQPASIPTCRSVDGCVRNYDIRMGKIRTDTIGRTCKSHRLRVNIQMGSPDSRAPKNPAPACDSQTTATAC